MSLEGAGGATPSGELPNTTMQTACDCGRPMTVKVTFGRPTTFVVVEGEHHCPVWASTCKSVVTKAEEGRRAAALSCPLFHDWRDAHAGSEPTPGCEKCEERTRKLARIESLSRENEGAHQEAARLGLLDEEDE